MKKMFFLSLLYLVYKVGGFGAINKLLMFSSSQMNRFILAKFGANIGQKTNIYSPLIIHNARHNYKNLTIGSNCHIGKDVFLDLKEKVIIEDNVTISMRVTILTHVDVGESRLKNKGFSPQAKGVIIRENSYVGAGATILHGVEIGEYVMVGAGAVVSKNIPGFSVAMGVSAKVVRKIT